jgi:hypothetical protein
LRELLNKKFKKEYNETTKVKKELIFKVDLDFSNILTNQIDKSAKKLEKFTDCKVMTNDEEEYDLHLFILLSRWKDHFKQLFESKEYEKTIKDLKTSTIKVNIPSKEFCHVIKYLYSYDITSFDGLFGKFVDKKNEEMTNLYTFLVNNDFIEESEFIKEQFGLKVKKSVSSLKTETKSNTMDMFSEENLNEDIKVLDKEEKSDNEEDSFMNSFFNENFSKIKKPKKDGKKKKKKVLKLSPLESLLAQDNKTILKALKKDHLNSNVLNRTLSTYIFKNK